MDDSSSERLKLPAETAHTSAFNAHDIFAHASNSVVEVNSHPPAGQEVGTGFFVSSGLPNSCEVATAAHVGHDYQVPITTVDGHSHYVHLELLDKRHEIAIYGAQVPNSEAVCKPLTIDSSGEAKGEPIVVVGANSADGDATATDHNYRTGTIEGLHKRTEYPARQLPGEDLTRPMMQANGNLKAPGYSGGPWLDGKGEVVGVHAVGANGFGVAELPQFLQEDLDIIKAERTKNGGKVKPIVIE
ncbi:MAG TPA: serine protease [Candidatus Obscuribacterales bacterium]